MQSVYVRPVPQFAPQYLDLSKKTNPSNLFVQAEDFGKQVVGKRTSGTLMDRLEDNKFKRLIQEDSDRIKSKMLEDMYSNSATNPGSGSEASGNRLGGDGSNPYQSVFYPSIEETTVKTETQTETPMRAASREPPDGVNRELQLFAERISNTRSSEEGGYVQTIVNQRNLQGLASSIITGAGGVYQAASLIANRVTGIADALVDTRGIAYEQAMKLIFRPFGPEVSNWVSSSYANVRRGTSSAAGQMVDFGVDSFLDMQTPQNFIQFLQSITAELGTGAVTTAGIMALPAAQQIGEQIITPAMRNNQMSIVTVFMQLLLFLNPSRGRQTMGYNRGPNGRLRPVRRITYN